ncbi:energy-coupling factor transporter transmembrane component T [Pseudoramibacter alactolyticus]|jgi:energy-coupling factor transport system permease protein|uniref:energy-coupling factor transporter transmembrane component T n=1 Tax=Pseudoramibacter alactolyticus TaxID=113287 RepID=UPI0028F0132A|nr:energy-coupling factor transporter transmembrane component T [Pseudoramibacter alactolyticus]
MNRLQLCKDSFVSINPLSKIATFFLASMIMLSSGQAIVENLVITVMFLLLLNTKKYSVFCKFLLVSLAFIALDYAVAAFKLPGILFLTAKFGKIFLPTLMGFYILSKETGSLEFMACFHRFKAPVSFQIPFVVMMRFIPSVQETVGNVMTALKIKGLTKKYFFRHPFSTMEYLVVPVLMSCSRSMDELASAAICRGFDCKRKRTCLLKSEFKFIDGALISLFLVLLCWKKVVVLWNICFA